MAQKTASGVARGALSGAKEGTTDLVKKKVDEVLPEELSKVGKTMIDDLTSGGN